MFKVLLVAPYPELENTATQIYEKHFKSSEFHVDIKVIRVEEIEKTILDNEYDLIIGRGYSAALFKKREIAASILEIPITGYDVLRALLKAKKLYGLEKILIIVSSTYNHDEKVLSLVAGSKIKVLEETEHAKITAVVAKAKSEGYKTIIGGYSVVSVAEEMGLNGLTIETGDEAIVQIMREAVRMKETILKEREQRKIYEIITQTSKEGIVYVNNKGEVKLANKKILQMIYTERGRVHGKKISAAYPFFSEICDNVMQSGQPLYNELQEIQNTRMSVDYTPVIVGNTPVGVVITCQTVKTIQQRESQLRKKLSEKGLIANYTFSDIIRKSELMEKTISLSQKYARVSSNILIVGETGTGKELMAQSIHNASERRNGPFVAINCAAFPENLLESELFGYVDGAFTGSRKGGKMGVFEQAHHGTLFLDEISEIPINFQGKLLRVLQERQVRRIGDDKVIDVDTRIIVATNRNLRQMVQNKEFRQDLLYRLDILKIYLPPLRERKDDILPLFYFFLKKYNNRFGKDIGECTPCAEQMLMEYNFEGNIRELRNITERIVVACENKKIDEKIMRAVLYPEDIYFIENPVMKQDEVEQIDVEPFLNINMEREKIIEMLRITGGKKGEAAERLGIDRTTLWRKMKSYHLE